MDAGLYKGERVSEPQIQDQRSWRFTVYCTTMSVQQRLHRDAQTNANTVDSADVTFFQLNILICFEKMDFILTCTYILKGEGKEI